MRGTIAKRLRKSAFRTAERAGKRANLFERVRGGIRYKSGPRRIYLDLKKLYKELRSQ